MAGGAFHLRLSFSSRLLLLIQPIISLASYPQNRSFKLGHWRTVKTRRRNSYWFQPLMERHKQVRLAGWRGAMARSVACIDLYSRVIYFTSSFPPLSLSLLHHSAGRQASLVTRKLKSLESQRLLLSSQLPLFSSSSFTTVLPADLMQLKQSKTQKPPSLATAKRVSRTPS